MDKDPLITGKWTKALNTEFVIKFNCLLWSKMNEEPLIRGISYFNLEKVRHWS